MTFTWMIFELADGMSERMKIREELSEVSSDDQNIMSASAQKVIRQTEIVHMVHVILVQSFSITNKFYIFYL